MRIVNRAEFLKLPEGTLYSKYRTADFDLLAIKAQTTGNDFLTMTLADAIAWDDNADFTVTCFRLEEPGVSIPVDLDFFGRDGSFEPDQMFAVWERADVLALVARLQECLRGAYPEPPQGDPR